MSEKQRVKNLTLTILTESPVALSNDQGTGGNFTPIKKYFYKNGLHAMTSVATVTYELRKILYEDYDWDLNDIVIKSKNLYFKENDGKEPDVFGFLTPGEQISKTSPLRIIPFISVHSFKNNTQLITNKGFLEKDQQRNYFDKDNDKIESTDVPQTLSMATEEIFGDYYFYTITIELDRIGRKEINEDEEYLPPGEREYFDDNERKEIVKDIISALTEFRRSIKHQTVHLKPLAVFGGLFKKVLPYFWNSISFNKDKLNLKPVNNTIKDYKLDQNGRLLYGIDQDMVNYQGDEDYIKSRPIQQMNQIEEFINKNILDIDNNKWFLNEEKLNN